MGNIGFKVMNAGTSIESNDPRDIIMSSKYSMFKYHSDTLGTLTFNAGDQDKYGTIPHNLGYIPAHISYNVNPIEGASFIIPSIPYGTTGYDYADCQCGTENMVVGYHFAEPYNQITYSADQIYHDLDTGEAHVLVGNADGNSYNSAVRFPSVSIAKNQTITSAQIEWTGNISGTTNSNTKYITWGIDEDNVGNVTTSSTKTTASETNEQSKVSGNFNFSTNVKSQVEEITTRSGWSSGNNMGFIIGDNGSPYNAYIGGNNSSNAFLTIILPGNISIRYRGIIFKDKIS